MTDDDRVILNMDPTTGHITKQTELGQVPIELSVARTHWDKLEVRDCNLAFQRLTYNDFDVAKTLQFYKDNI